MSWELGTFSTHVRVVMASLCPLAWDSAWVASERRRTLKYICSRAADGDLPHLHDEYAEVWAAQAEHDTTRFSTAICELVRSGLRALRDEGRLLSEPASAPSADPECDGAPGSSTA